MSVRVCLPAIAVLLMSACQSSADYKTPELDVSVELSEAAQAKLSALGEDLKVVAFFDGDSKNGPSEKNAPFRAVYLGSVEATTKPGRTAHLNGIGFSREQSAQLVKGEYHLLLNVVSGRRVASSNLLNCENPELLISASPPAPIRSINVKCALIGERAGA